MEDTNMDTRSDVSNDQVQPTSKILIFKATELPEQYKAIIYAKYLRTLRSGNDFYKLIDNEPYYQVQAAYLGTLITRPAAEVRLAVLTDDPDTVVGWALLEPNKLHYVWVAKDGRKDGMMNFLLQNHTFTAFSHLTKSWMSIWHSKYPTVKFNPYC